MKKLLFLFSITQATFNFSQSAYVLGDPIFCEGDEVTLYAGGDNQYAWAVSSDQDSILSTESYFSYLPEEGDTVYLYTSNDTVVTPLLIDPYQCDYHFYAPNIFTPDGDLFNNKFCPILYGKETKGVRLTICDRSGKVIFDKTDLDCPCWDGKHPDSGKLVQSEMYVWFVSYIRQDYKVVHETGFVILSR